MRVTRVVSPAPNLTQEAADPEQARGPQERPVAFRHFTKPQPANVAEHLIAWWHVRVGSDQRLLIPDVDEKGNRLVPGPVAHVDVWRTKVPVTWHSSRNSRSAPASAVSPASWAPPGRHHHFVVISAYPLDYLERPLAIRGLGCSPWRDSEWPPYLAGVVSLALQVAPDLHATDLARLLVAGSVHGPGLIDPGRVVERARAQGAEEELERGRNGTQIAGTRASGP